MFLHRDECLLNCYNNIDNSIHCLQRQRISPNNDSLECYRTEIYRTKGQSLDGLKVAQRFPLCLERQKQQRGRSRNVIASVSSLELIVCQETVHLADKILETAILVSSYEAFLMYICRVCSEVALEYSTWLVWISH